MMERQAEKKEAIMNGSTNILTYPIEITCQILNEQERQEERRQPVLRQALRPILMLMRIFGLYYNKTSNKKMCDPDCKSESKFWSFYTYFMNLVILGLLGKSISGMWFVDKVDGSDGYYLLTIYIIFSGKTVCQCLYILYLVHQNILWGFITDLECFLNQIILCECNIVEKKFLKKLRRWLIFFVFFLIFCLGTNSAVKYLQVDELQTLNKYLMLPIQSNDTGYFILKLFFDAILLAGWFLPVALCGTLMASLHYTINEYYRYLQKVGEKGICVKNYIKEIRHKFLRLSKIRSNLDCMVSVLLMISYLGDLCLVCLILRLGIYTFHSLYGRLFIFGWILPPMFTLLYLSQQASQLHDKGQEMFSIIQYFDTDHATIAVKMEFDMLLFHMNTEPFVMTIWQMIPLYRSIIISIFVSIITYFALIISL